MSLDYPAKYLNKKN